MSLLVEENVSACCSEKAKKVARIVSGSLLVVGFLVALTFGGMAVVHTGPFPPSANPKSQCYKQDK